MRLRCGLLPHKDSPAAVPGPAVEFELRVRAEEAERALEESRKREKALAAQLADVSKRAIDVSDWEIIRAFHKEANAVLDAEREHRLAFNEQRQEKRFNFGKTEPLPELPWPSVGAENDGVPSRLSEESERQVNVWTSRRLSYFSSFRSDISSATLENEGRWPWRASIMASAVFRFGTRTSNGSAFSVAIRFRTIRTTSETDKPIFFSDLVASVFVRSSILT